MRKQRAFAALTDEEIEQIADWLKTGTYDDVRVRLAKPRPEGFTLKLKSNRPLQTLFAKKNLIIKINSRLAEGKPMTVSELEKIAGDNPELPDDSERFERVYDAIMDATYDLAISGDNTPAQLLTLQRLADFPERAELRATKEQRQIEMHSHKLEMDAHRNHIAKERLDLSRKSFDLRERLALQKSNSQLESLPPGHYIDKYGRECDHLGPLAKNINDGDAISARACKKFGIAEKVGMTSMSSQDREEPVESGVRPDSLHCVIA